MDINEIDLRKKGLKEADILELGREEGKKFVRENYNKVTPDFNITGKIYLKGFMEGYIEQYEIMQQSQNIENESAKTM